MNNGGHRALSVAFPEAGPLHARGSSTSFRVTRMSNFIILSYAVIKPGIVYVVWHDVDDHFSIGESSMKF